MGIWLTTREPRRAEPTRVRRGYTIARRDLAEQPTAVVRAELPAEELGGWLGVAHHAVAHYLRSRGVAPAGPPFARVAVVDGTATVEAGLPVNVEIECDGYVEPAELPAGPAVVATHFGRYEGLESAYEALDAWVATHGHSPAGPAWEVYSTDPNAEPDPGQWHTDVVLPYRRNTVRRWRRR